MAVSFAKRTCETCGGTLKFDGQKNVFVCQYCGNTYERTESYDGAYSVRNAAIQALNSMTSLGGTLDGWSLVQDNLNECMKIDPSYIGSTIAQLAASVQRAMILAPNGREAVRADLDKAQTCFAKLPQPFDTETCLEEAEFYSKIDSSDVRTLLTNVFSAFHDNARVDFINNGIDVGDIHSTEAAMTMINRAFSAQDWDLLDKALQSPAAIDTGALFKRLLEQYPDNDHKAGNIAGIITRGVDEQTVSEDLSRYLSQTSDSARTRYAVCSSCMARGIVPDGAGLCALFQALTDESDTQSEAGESIIALLGELPEGRLSDADTASIVGFILAKTSGKDIPRALGALKESGYFIDLRAEDILAVLVDDSRSVDDRIALWNTACGMGLEPRRRQIILSDYLGTRPSAADLADSQEQQQDSRPAKIRILEAIAKNLPDGVNPLVVENYLMKQPCPDGERKPDIINVLLSFTTVGETLRRKAIDYQNSTPDTPQTTTRVLEALASHGVIQTIGGALGQTGVEAMRSAGVSASPSALDEYLRSTLGTLNGQAFDQVTAQNLVVAQSRVSAPMVVAYLLSAPDSMMKAQFASRLLKACPADLSAPITINLPGGQFTAPMLQCYLVANQDSEQTAAGIVEALKQYTAKLNVDVEYMGNSMKFRKFVRSGFVNLPASTSGECMQIGLFS